jgi:hypothetical protein
LLIWRALGGHHVHYFVFTYYSWHMVATKYHFFESWMRWPPSGHQVPFFGFLWTRRWLSGHDQVAMTKSLFPLLLIGMALGGHESPFFSLWGLELHMLRTMCLFLSLWTRRQPSGHQVFFSPLCELWRHLVAIKSLFSSSVVFLKNICGLWRHFVVTRSFFSLP